MEFDFFMASSNKFLHFSLSIAAVTALNYVFVEMGKRANVQVQFAFAVPHFHHHHHNFLCQLPCLTVFSLNASDVTDRLTTSVCLCLTMFGANARLSVVHSWT